MGGTGDGEGLPKQQGRLKKDITLKCLEFNKVYILKKGQKVDFVHNQFVFAIYVDEYLVCEKHHIYSRHEYPEVNIGIIELLPLV